MHSVTENPIGKKEGLLSIYRDVCCHEEQVVNGEATSLLPDGRRFRLVWHDEFNGDSLDVSKWGYRLNFWGRRAPWYATPEDQAVEVKDGKVHLKIIRRTDGQLASPQLQTGELLWDYPQERVDGRLWFLPPRRPPKFTHALGYYECRCRLQQEPGWWSAFWMQTETQGANLDPARSGIEHDIMESFEPGLVAPHAFHYNGYGDDYRTFNSTYVYDREQEIGRDITPVDKSVFHTFALLWEPTGYTAFIDGRPSGHRLGMRGQGKYQEAVSLVPEFILLSTEVNGFRNPAKDHPPLADSVRAAEMGDAFIIDHVRVFDLDE